MGYTHYWYLNRKGSQANYDKALKVIKTIIKNNKKFLAGYDGTGTPDTTDGISFNGKGDNAHETFSLPKTLSSLKDRRGDSDYVFHFCKTAEKPYDIIVTQCLTVLKHYLGNDIKISSDGGKEGFNKAIEILNKQYGSPKTKQLRTDVNVLEFNNPVTEE